MSDSQGSTVVTFAILAPVLLFLVLAVVQVAIVSHVRHVATLAATAAVGETAAFDGDAASGVQRAEDQLGAASGWLLDPVVTASRSDVTASVVIEANAFTVLPFGTWEVRVERTGPVERPQG